MKTSVCLLFALPLSFLLYGQADTTLYYGQYNFHCDAKSARWYLQLHFTNKSTGECEGSEYYINGKIKRSKGSYIKHDYDMYLDGPSTGSLIRRESDIFAIGPFINYYENGNKESEGTYFCDSAQNLWGGKEGKWTEYYPNGQAKWVYYYDAFERDTLRRQVLDYWDSSGVQSIKDGNGSCCFRALIHIPIFSTYGDFYITSNYKNGLLDGKHKEVFAGTGNTFCEEEYAAGNLVRGTSYDIDGKAYTYTQLKEPAQYPGGEERLLKFIHKHISYPEFERNYHIEGKVLVSFAVEKDGSINDVKIYRGVTKGLDEETIKVIKMLHKFKPATFKGQKIRSTYSQIQNYKLN